MRTIVKKFVELCSIYLPIEEPIYEFGARQVEGQEGFADLRHYFKGKKYIGADQCFGKGVDVLLDLHAINLPSNSVGTVICCDTFEHVEFPRRAISEIHRILKPGGIVILTSVMYFPIHNKPDYWRFTPQGFSSLLSSFRSKYVSLNKEGDTPVTIVGIGCKGCCSFNILHSRKDEWQKIPDVPLYLKLLAPLVSLKKKVIP